MAELTDAYFQQEAAKMRAMYGEQAEIPYAPSEDRLRVGLVGQPITVPIQQRIAEAAKRVTDAGYELGEARMNYDNAARTKEQCHLAFVRASEEMVRLLHEHREGTAEAVPYQS